MEPHVVQDSDDDGNDDGLTMPVVFPQTEQAKGTRADLMRGLHESHAKMIAAESAQSNGANSTGMQQEQPSIVPTISLQTEQSNGSMSVPALTTSETIESDQTTARDVEELQGGSQKRKASVELTDEDEVLFVPARKKQRGQPTATTTTTEAATKASMPPPASQESIASRMSATSQRSALRVQPSPPRMQDNMSFTTTTSSATSFQGTRGDRMFPALDSDSFQQRLNDMDIDQDTDLDGMSVSEEDPTVAAPRPPSTQNQGIKPSLDGSEKSNGDVSLEESPPSSSDASSALQSKEAPIEKSGSEDHSSENSQSNSHASEHSSTMVRVEVRVPQSDEEESGYDDYPALNATTQESNQSQEPPKSSIPDADLADGEDNAADDTIKVETKRKTKKPKPKNGVKRRGRPARKQPAEDEHSVPDEEDASNEPDASDTRSSASNEDSKNAESAAVSNATSFVADTPSPELAAGEPVSIPPATPDKDSSDGARSGKHSPLNNGKVPLRVGLSKRVQIEPLLRIVRK